MLLGVVWGAVIVLLAPHFIWWMLPVLAGLLLCVPLTMWSSGVGAGRLARRLGLFTTPEENAPPPELAAVDGAFVYDPPEAAVTLPAAQALPATVAPLTMENLPPCYALAGRAALERLQRVAQGAWEEARRASFGR